MPPLFSVVIVSYNRQEDVGDAVDSVLRQTDASYELLVIDDASSPPITLHQDTAVRLFRFDVERGLSASRNYGIRHARGAYVAFLDDDAVADERWLAALRRGVDAGGEILGGPILPLYEQTPPGWWDPRAFGFYASVGNDDDEIWGTNMVVKKALFPSVGVFRADLGRQQGKLVSSEDVDLVERGRRHGAAVAFVKDAVVHHKVKHWRMTLPYILTREYYKGKSMNRQFGRRSLTHTLRMAAKLPVNVLALFGALLLPSDHTTRIFRMGHIMNLLGQLT